MAKVVFIGAGSFGFTRNLVRDLLTFDALSDTEIEAGGETEVSCLVTDAYNNPIEGFPFHGSLPSSRI